MTHKIIKGEIMSASRRGGLRRRLSLLAGSSLAAATIVAGVGTGALLAPTVALAANECGDPTANGAGADSFTCSDTTTFSAITYPATSGNLTLRLQNDVTVTTGGIVITPTGSNTVTINRLADSPALSGDPQITSTIGAGISIIRPAPNNGNITVTLTDNDVDDAPMSLTGTTAGIYLSNAGTGATTLTSSNGTITATAGVGVRLGTVGSGAITFNNGSTVTGTTGAVLIAEGVNATIANSGDILGSVTFNNTGTSTFTNGGVWQASGTMAFGSGASTLTNNNRIIADGTLVFSSLETFNNAGTLIFGAGSDFTVTDGLTNDRIVPGTNFNVTGAGSLMMDLRLGGPDQLSCAAAVTADCLDLTGFSVVGPAGTDIILNVAGSNAGVWADRIVLVDAAGGSVTAGQFVLSPSSAGYMANASGQTGVDAGIFAYTLFTDEAADQVYVAASPGSTPLQLSQLPHLAEAAWDLTAGALSDRQLELHGASGGSGLWIRGLSGYVDDGAARTAGPFSFDVGYDQETTALAVGADFVGGEGWAVGAMLASLQSDVNPDAGAASHELEGYGAGAYASWTSGRLYVDGLVNYASLDVSSTLAADEGEATVFGAQAEAGYRLPLGGGITLEPLAALAYVSTDTGELTMPDGTSVGSDSASNIRAGLGVRIAGGAEIVGLTTRFSFTGRGWRQFGDDPEMTIAGPGGSQSFIYDDDRDTLGDVAFSAGVFGIAERLSLSASARLKFKEDYEAGELVLGLLYSF